MGIENFCAFDARKVINKYRIESNIYVVGGYSTVPYAVVTKFPLGEIHTTFPGNVLISDELINSKEHTLRIPQLVSDNPMEIECPSCTKQWTGLHSKNLESDVAALPLAKYEGYRFISADNDSGSTTSSDFIGLC